MIVERLADADGNLARNLTVIIRNRYFDDIVKSDLALFLNELRSSPLYFDDLYAANIVYGFDKNRGQYRFVLVDGIGHKMLIPLVRLLPSLERRQKKRQIERLYDDISRLRGLRG
jgi:hypothetical protein